jgi:two-component system, OmpR family, response regulator
MTLAKRARRPATTAGVDRNGRDEIARILVVDDEPKLVDVVCRALSEEGFSVDSATDGGRGLALIQNRDYELVVLDLVMQGIDGFTVLERVASSHPHPQVMILSVRDDVETKVRCFQSGATDYLTKPFALAELVARVRARLGIPAREGEAILENNGLKLDLKARVAQTEKGVVRLSDREFRLLRCLMRHQGDICTRPQLLEEVWGCQFDPGTNVVDVYVGRLRAKLGSSIITTVRNVGYYVPPA